MESARIVSTRYGKTHVTLAGNPQKPPLVIFHGWGIHHSEVALHWDFDRLADEFYLICPEALGHSGRSDVFDMPTRTDAYGLWCADVLDGLQIERAYLAGNSGGAFMALKLAACVPNRVSGLCLSNPSGIVRHWLTPIWAWAMLPVLVYPTEATARRFVRLMNTDAMPAWQQENFTRTLHHLYKQRKLMKYNPVPLSDADLRRIVCPIHIALGEFHPICNLKALEKRVKTLCPQTTVERLPDAGHILSAEQQSALVLNCLERWTGHPI